MIGRDESTSQIECSTVYRNAAANMMTARIDCANDESTAHDEELDTTLT